MNKAIFNLQSRPNFETGEYKYRAFLPYERIKVGMMVLSEDDCDKPKPIPFMCKVTEIGTGTVDIGDGKEKSCYVLRIVARSGFGAVIYDWTIRPVIPDEYDDCFKENVYFRTKEEAAAFGVDPSELYPEEIKGVDPVTYTA